MAVPFSCLAVPSPFRLERLVEQIECALQCFHHARALGLAYPLDQLNVSGLTLNDRFECGFCGAGDCRQGV
jgi:hypothetical protein